MVCMQRITYLEKLDPIAKGLLSPRIKKRMERAL